MALFLVLCLWVAIPNCSEAENVDCVCREAAVPALAGGDRHMQDSFSDRRPQTDRFPRSDSFGAAEAMPEGKLLATLAYPCSSTNPTFALSVRTTVACRA